MGMSASEREAVLEEMETGFPIRDALKGISCSELKEKFEEQLKVE